MDNMDNNENNQKSYIKSAFKWSFYIIEIIINIVAFYQLVTGNTKLLFFLIFILIVIAIAAVKFDLIQKNNEKKGFIIAITMICLFLIILALINISDKKNTDSSSTTISETTTTLAATSQSTDIEESSGTNTDSNSSSATETIEPVTSIDSGNGDSYLSPEKLELNTSVEVNVDYYDDYYSDDEDNKHWFVITPTYSGELNLVLTPSESLQPTLELYGDDGETEISDSSSENSIINLVTPIQKGTYYICVSYCASGSFQLANELKTSVYANDVEINDSFQNALDLELPSTQTGNIGHYNSKNECDNSDFYKLVINSSQVVKVEFEGDPDLNVEISILQSNGDSEISDDSGSNKKLSIIQPLHKGTYYITVYRQDGYGGYKLTSSTEIINKLDAESNNYYQEAKKIKSNTKVSGNLGFKSEDGSCDEEDWYAIKLNKKKSISIEVVPNTSLSLYVALIDKDGSSTIYEDIVENKTLKLDTDVIKAGTYYIRLSLDNSSFGTYDMKYR